MVDSLDSTGGLVDLQWYSAVCLCYLHFAMCPSLTYTALQKRIDLAAFFRRVERVFIARTAILSLQ